MVGAWGHDNSCSASQWCPSDGILGVPGGQFEEENANTEFVCCCLFFVQLPFPRFDNKTASIIYFIWLLQLNYSLFCSWCTKHNVAIARELRRVLVEGRRNSRPNNIVISSYLS